MTYTITLANGKKLTGLGKNGSNYISKTKVDESIFAGNLKTVTVTDSEGGTETMTDAVFIQQQKWADGYYLAFRELSDGERREQEITDMQTALAEVYEMMLGGE